MNADFIIRARERLGSDGIPMSQTDFAKLIPARRETVCRWENGQKIHAGYQALVRKLLADRGIRLRESV